MAMRVASIKKDQYDKCVEFGLWGDERSSVKRWDVEDLLVFKVENKIKSIAKVTGLAFEDDLLIWDNGFYPNRIPIIILKEFDDEKAVEIYEVFRKSMLEIYGEKYGWVILNKHPLIDKIEDKLASYIDCI